MAQTIVTTAPLVGSWDARLTTTALRSHAPGRGPRDPEDLLGTVLPGRFRIDRMLARGGFGTVYLARQLAVGRDVAVKVLDRRVTASSEVGRLFVQEIQCVGRIDHPNVVRIHQADITASGELFYAMELLAGSDLERVIEREGVMPRDRALRLVLQLLDALAAAHDACLVHADVKPANTFVVPEKHGERLVLLDFGLARLPHLDALRVRSVYVECRGGTSAPEVARAVWHEGDDLVSAVSARLAAERKLVVVFDQLEAWLADGAGRALLAQLAALVRLPADRELTIVLAVREDFLASATAHEGLHALPVLRLGPLSAAGARDAIVHPLLERRITITEPGARGRVSGAEPARRGGPRRAARRGRGPGRGHSRARANSHNRSRMSVTACRAPPPSMAVVRAGRHRDYASMGGTLPDAQRSRAHARLEIAILGRNEGRSLATGGAELRSRVAPRVKDTAPMMFKRDPSKHVNARWSRGALLVAALAGCQSGPPTEGKEDDPANNADIAEALRALPDAVVMQSSPDGVPQFLLGELGKIDPAHTDDRAASDSRLRPALAPILKAFRLTNADLMLRKVRADEQGGRHYRYDQVADGLPVVGGDLVVHVDVKGAITGVNGTARGGVPTAAIAAFSERAASDAIAADPRFASLRITGSRLVFVQTEDGAVHKAYEQIAEGVRGQNPVRDKVFVDVETGRIVAVHPTIHSGLYREVYVGSVLRRREGDLSTGDLDVDAVYDNTGSTYWAYNFFFGRDSYDNAGAPLRSQVHYGTNYCNAFWDGSKMVYGDGDPAQSCLPLSRSVDVTAHELTHAVTEYESNLTYSGESGGLNESYSDIFGAFVEAYVDGGSNGTLAINNGTFLIGDEVLPPFLRNMCDPVADGVSRDVWSSGIGGVDVHYSSGPNNLAFCLLTKGGTHPRGKTTNTVPAIGMEKAARIFYKANVDYLTSSSNYAAMRNAAIAAAQQLGYDQATQDAIACAYAAIAVGTAPASCGGTPPPPPDGVLVNGVAVTGLADGTAGSLRYWKLDVPPGGSPVTFSISGGTGDADLYVQSGTKPTTSSFQCRPYLAGNAETCTFTPATAGTYWVGLYTYAPYANVTLIGTYGVIVEPWTLQNGIPITNRSGAANSEESYRVLNVPAGRTLTIRISGGTGDADLYTRFNDLPTTTAYACRPYLTGNNETCTHTTTVAGTWWAKIRGYSAYSGVQIIASW